MENSCIFCGEPIFSDSKVYTYSMKEFNTLVCFDCQKNARVLLKNISEISSENIEESQSTNFFIGVNHGEKIEAFIKKAKKSVEIISPFISENMIQKLLELDDEIAISVITNDIRAIGKVYDKDINGRQKIACVLYSEDEKKKKHRKYLKWGMNLILFLLCSFFILYYVSPALKLIISMGQHILILVVLSIIWFYIATQRQAIRTKNYSYSSSSYFKIKLFREYNKVFQNKTTTIHSKVYIIDKEVLLTGSINFTQSGMHYNHETLVQTTDKNVINRFCNEFNNIWNKSTKFNSGSFTEFQDKQGRTLLKRVFDDFVSKQPKN